MIKKIKISTKLQNIILGAILSVWCLGFAYEAFTKLSSVNESITNQEIAELKKRVRETEQSITRYTTSIFESMGEIYYDDRIKKAALTKQTRLFPVYQGKAHDAIREFALFKDLKNIFLFDDNYNLISSINRSIFLSRQNIDDLRSRLENYKEKQLIIQTIDKKRVVIFIFRLDFSESNNAFVVVMEDLEKLTDGLSDYENEKAEFFLFTKTLDYKNSFIKLKAADSIDYFTLQEDTLMRFNSGFVRSFNAEGKETLSRVRDLKDYQHAFIVGLMKPAFLTNEIAKNKARINSYYSFCGFWVLALLIVYALLVVSKANIQDGCTFVIKKVMQKLRKEDSLKPKDLSNRAKKQAYSYIEDENALKNSVFKVYNSLRKLSPEDIRNLSIKNSLSKENIRLVYQPVVDSKTMQPQFCEVFLRLLNYYGEELMPSEFLPVLEHFSMMENLDEMMLEKVTRKVQSLQSNSPSAKISLNISDGAFNSHDFLRKLKANLIKGIINVDNVMLEIPGVEIINNSQHSAFIKDLRGYGVEFISSIKDTLDISTIKKLLEHDIQYIRIDMSRFSDVLENTETQAQLKQILSNANKNGLKIIAERIETEFMFKLAKSLDIQYLQGYYIGKPKKYFTHKEKGDN